MTAERVSIRESHISRAQSAAGRLWRALRRPQGTIHCGTAPAPQTQLGALNALVLDTETTGLNVRSDRIISVAGYRLVGGALEPEPAFDRLIDPQRAIPPASTAFHGIVDRMVAGQGNFAAHWPDLHHQLSTGLIIGHQIFFDLAILGREVRRLGAKLQPPVALDTALLYAALHPGQQHRDLTPCCAEFGITVVDRHTARGDAEATAKLFLCLVPLLQDHGIHTLGEALAFERAAMLQHPRRWRW